MTAQEAAEKVSKEHKGSFQIDEGATFGSALSSALRDKGWKSAKMYSACSKATFQTKLQEPDSEKVVNITSAFFLGSFTQVDFYPQNW